MAQGIRRVDLRGVEPGGREWEEARAAVSLSMEAVGAVLVVQDALGSELRRALFGRAMPEFFALPLDVKQGLVSGPINGYIGPTPYAPTQESMRIWETTNGGGVRNVGDVLWPGRTNPAFCDTVSAFAANMLDLQRKVGTMVLESMDVVKPERVLDSLNYHARMSHYWWVSSSDDGDGDDAIRPAGLGLGLGLLMKPHRDCSLLTVVVQHGVEGLEVQAKDGTWLAVPPEPDTVAVIAGEILAVVTNGRVPACVHRVSARRSGRERLSAQFVSVPKDGLTVVPLDELVDGDHPRRYNPCDFDDYVRFRFAGDGRQLSDPLEAFCGSIGAAVN